MRQYDETIMAKRIKLVEKYLGESSDPQCKHCEWFPIAMGQHAPDCALRKIDPLKLAGMVHEAKAEVRKKINRQRIWRGEVKAQGRGGERKETACRKQKRPPGKIKQDLKRCSVCKEQRLFLRGICQTCKHEKPCEWVWNTTKCKLCHPKPRKKLHKKKKKGKKR